MPVTHNATGFNAKATHSSLPRAAFADSLKPGDIPGNGKLLLPPRQSRGNPLGLERRAASGQNRWTPSFQNGWTGSSECAVLTANIGDYDILLQLVPSGRALFYRRK